MRLPETIVTRKKIRDAKICELYARDLLTYKKIGSIFGISASRVERILYLNREFIKSNKEWEKTKRKVWLKRQIGNNGHSQKDSADLMEQLRKEEEGDKGTVIDQSQHLHFTKINDTDLIKQARERGLDLPAGIEARIGEESTEQRA